MSWRSFAAPLLAGLVSLASVAPLLSQTSSPVPAVASEPSVEVPTIYLVTVGPGRFVWERFGHNAIWVHDPAHGTDRTYDYGRFSFLQENFILRFIQGRMWYSMGSETIDQTIGRYRQDNRSLWIQELDLPSEARLQLQAFLQWNYRRENRDYHYDYYRDNCSTRIRDALDRVLRGQFRAQTEHVAVPATYRFHTQRLMASDLPIYTGLYAALGPGVDRPLSAWDEMFLPLALREHIRHVMVRDANGREQPLVKVDRTIYESTDPPPPAAPPAWGVWYLVAGLVAGGGVALVSRHVARSRAARRVIAVWSVVWGVAIGVAGLVLAGLWLATDHVMAYRNLNLFHINPLVLPLAVLLPVALRRAAWARRAAWSIAAAAAGVSVVGALVHLLPGVDQVNGPIVALMLPIHLGVAYAAWNVAKLHLGAGAA